MADPERKVPSQAAADPEAKAAPSTFSLEDVNNELVDLVSAPDRWLCGPTIPAPGTGVVVFFQQSCFTVHACVGVRWSTLLPIPACGRASL